MPKLIDDVDYIRRRMDEIEQERKLAKAQIEARHTAEEYAARQQPVAPMAHGLQQQGLAQGLGHGLLNQPTNQTTAGLPPLRKKRTL
jgi:hypothetical protein